MASARWFYGSLLSVFLISLVCCLTAVAAAHVNSSNGQFFKSTDPTADEIQSSESQNTPSDTSSITRTVKIQTDETIPVSSRVQFTNFSYNSWKQHRSNQAKLDNRFSQRERCLYTKPRWFNDHDDHTKLQRRRREYFLLKTTVVAILRRHTTSTTKKRYPCLSGQTMAILYTSPHDDDLPQI